MSSFAFSRTSYPSLARCASSPVPFLLTPLSPRATPRLGFPVPKDRFPEVASFCNLLAGKTCALLLLGWVRSALSFWFRFSRMGVHGFLFFRCRLWRWGFCFWGSHGLVRVPVFYVCLGGLVFRTPTLRIPALPCFVGVVYLFWLLRFSYVLVFFFGDGGGL